MATQTFASRYGLVYASWELDTAEIDFNDGEYNVYLDFCSGNCETPADQYDTDNIIGKINKNGRMVPLKGNATGIYADCRDEYLSGQKYRLLAIKEDTHERVASSEAQTFAESPNDIIGIALNKVGGTLSIGKGATIQLTYPAEGEAFDDTNYFVYYASVYNAPIKDDEGNDLVIPLGTAIDTLNGIMKINEVRLSAGVTSYTVVDKQTKFSPSSDYRYIVAIRAENPAGAVSSAEFVCGEVTGRTASCLQFVESLTPGELCVVDKEDYIAAAQNGVSLKPFEPLTFARLCHSGRYLNVIAFRGDASAQQDFESWLNASSENGENALEYALLAEGHIPVYTVNPNTDQHPEKEDITHYIPVISGTLKMWLTQSTQLSRVLRIPESFPYSTATDFVIGEGNYGVPVESLTEDNVEISYAWSKNESVGDDAEYSATTTVHVDGRGDYYVKARLLIPECGEEYIEASFHVTGLPLNGVVFSGNGDEGEVYDGNAHVFTLTGTEGGDLIRYSTDGEVYNLTACPEYTNAGEYTVYVMVDRDQTYEPFKGYATVKINQKPLTLTFDAEGKVYDGTTAVEVTNYGVEGLVEGETLTIDISTIVAEFDNKNVGSSDDDYLKTVNIIGYETSGSDINNYLISIEQVQAAITPQALTLVFTAEDRDYDGTDDAVIKLDTEDSSCLAELIEGDDVSVTITGKFEDKNAGDDKNIINISYELEGEDAGNYNATANESSLTASIRPKQVSLMFVGESKVYNGSLAAAVSYQFEGKEPEDILIAEYEDAVFEDSNAGTDKEIIVSGISVSGSDVGNYQVAYDDPAQATGDILKADIEGVSFDDEATFEYDGQQHSLVLNGLTEEDHVSYVCNDISYNEMPSFKDAGTYSVAATVTRGGTNGSPSNYNDLVLSATLVIDPKQLTVSDTTVADKVYNGTTDAEITLGEVQGIEENDDVTVSVSGAFSTADVNSDGVRVTYTISGTAAGNYIAPTAETVAASITPASIEGFGFQGYSGTYDGEEHSCQLIVPEGDETDNYTIRFSEDGVEYNLTTNPSYTLGSHDVWVKITRPNYSDWTNSATPATVTIAESVITLTHLNQQPRVEIGTNTPARVGLDLSQIEFTLNGGNETQTDASSVINSMTAIFSDTSTAGEVAVTYEASVKEGYVISSMDLGVDGLVYIGYELEQDGKPSRGNGSIADGNNAITTTEVYLDFDTDPGNIADNITIRGASKGSVTTEQVSKEVNGETRVVYRFKVGISGFENDDKGEGSVYISVTDNRIDGAPKKLTVYRIMAYWGIYPCRLGGTNTPSAEQILRMTSGGALTGSKPASLNPPIRLTEEDWNYELEQHPEVTGEYADYYQWGCGAEFLIYLWDTTVTNILNSTNTPQISNYNTWDVTINGSVYSGVVGGTCDFPSGNDPLTYYLS